MRRTVAVDASYWIALYSPSDRHHEAAAQKAVLLSDHAPVTTWPVLTETCHLLGRFGGVETQTAFVNYCAEWVEIFEFTKHDLQRAATLMKKFADLPMDLADASLVMLAEALGHGRILTTDRRDFRAYRWKSHHPFENLMDSPE